MPRVSKGQDTPRAVVGVPNKSRKRSYLARSFIVRLLLSATLSSSMASNNPPTLPTALSESASLPSQTYAVTSQCACGQVQVRANVSSSQSSPLERMDCHCSTCRKFHAAAFVSYLPVHDGDDYQVLRGTTVTYKDSCSGLPFDSGAEDSTGTPQPVLRIVCGKCNSKLLTTTTTSTLPKAEEEEGGGSGSRSQEAQTKRSWINMGPLLEGKGRFPTPLLALKPRSTGGTPVAWSLARPHEFVGDDETAESTRPAYAHGRCACGKVRYRILNEETELQHCYCRLCRQYSGGPFMTWMPAPYLEWLDANGQPDQSTAPPLVRTTSHGQRHFCPSCRACLTIVYDEQPETIWPVAASLEDSTALTLYGVSHICCRYRPRWYELPKDGLPRIQEAS